MLTININPEILAPTISGLQELAQRLEIDAASLARLDSREAALLAEETLERAAAVRKAADYYLNL